MRRAGPDNRNDRGAGDNSQSPRHGHLAARIRRAIQTLLLKGLNDPRVRGMISVTEVDLAPDHSRILVHVSVLPAEAGRLTIAGLNHAAPRLAGEVGRMVRAKRIPMLDFRLDERLKKQAALDAAIIASKGEDAQ